MTTYNSNPFETHTSSSSSSSEVQTLKEAFPAIDVDIIKDVLFSVNGNVQDAFENLLHMSDPPAHTGSGGSITKQLPPTPTPQIPQRRGGGCHNNNNRNGGRCGSSRSQRVSPPRRGCSDNNNPFLNGCRGNTRVRQDLAQWREQLAEESRQRRQNAKDHWRTSCSSARLMTPSFASSTGESRNYYNGGHNSGGLGDALSHLVEAGKNVALSKANTALAAAVNEANTALAKATDPSRSNTHIRGVGFSFNTPQRSHSDSNIYHQHQQAASTITPISASVRPTPPTPSSNSRQHHHHQHTRNNNPNTPVDRNRPLPTPPQHSASTSSINPFDPVVSPNDELPPPSYEAHFHDRRVELHDVDRIMQSTAQVSRST